MEKYNSIKEYCEKNNMTVEDFKDMMLTSAINLGCSVERNFDDTPHDTAQVFSTLFYFNDILNNVK
jgi:hypothetical protein